MENIVSPVTIVTIKEKIPLFKGEEQASSIELILLEEYGFELVSRKDLYQVGNKAIYIQPDYCLSDIPLFEDFLRPNGDPKKTMLGSNNRIRAKKFNLHRGDNNPVYSNGILLPIEEISKSLNIWDFLNVDLTKELGITKWEEPETNTGNIKVGASKPFPEGIYKTDESNIHNCWNKIDFPITFVGLEKIDGSSITIGVKNNKGFICSRNLEKPLTYMKTIGRRKKTFIEKLFAYWIKPDLNIKEEVPNDQDDFVKYGKPYLDKLLLTNENNTVLRGELHGGSLKGSGNKNNPARLESPNIKFFGIDYINTSGFAEKVTYSEFKATCKFYELNTPKEVFNKEFNSIQELLEECNNYFKDNMIEGIVVRTLDSKQSYKVMNLEYDSKK